MSDELKCTQTDDARVWAQDFVKTAEKNNWSLGDIDEELMFGWFANAIECSTDIQNKKIDRALAMLERIESLIIEDIKTTGL